MSFYHTHPLSSFENSGIVYDVVLIVKLLPSACTTMTDIQLPYVFGIMKC